MKKVPAPQPVIEERDLADLPEGWAQSTLSEICDINPPKPAANSVHEAELVTFVPMPAVDETLGAISKPDLRPFSKVRKGYTAFRDNDVIMAKITPCMENGKAAIARGLQNGLGFGSTEFHVLRSLGAVLPDYVYHFIRRDTYRNAAEAEMTGSVGQKRVPAAFLESSTVSLPPLGEQRRIVAKIEALFEQNRTVSSHLAKVPKMLKAFRQSVLAAACSGRLTEDWRERHPVEESAEILLARIDQEQAKSSKTLPQKTTDNDNLTDLPELPDLWRWAAMGRVADIQGGIQKQPKRAPRKHAYPYLRVANVLRDHLDLSEIQNMELFEGELETYRLRHNDLLIVEGNGSINEIGRSALWTGEIKDCVHQNHIIRVRARLCFPEYLNIYWNSPIGIGRVKDEAVTTAGLYSLSTKKVASLSAPIAPLEEQHEIVRRVEALFTLAEKIEERVATATKHADKLTQSILAKAFRGELVPTEAELARKEGRDYEPAPVLLERIKSERQKVVSTSNGPKRARRSGTALVRS